MIYTIGHRPSYTKALEDENPTKLGPIEKPDFQEEPYPGGVAFTTPEAARKCIETYHKDKDYSVYALDGEEEDIYESSPGEFSIKRDLRILGEVNEICNTITEG